ncbi:hypothetical protein [Clostridium beijerinckii]|uniref:hypothetical protein n=1 Tax=Clostridium beijerinckii TaxID=1520 RepID=UPI00149489B1|nr:hypothetical protein [Clostridium beijerinckii]NOW07651.1 hypothetical protein [Clostridium beijerinckii]NYC04576.1 hypothetical protein [Clostridium beijerinckii]
MKYKRMKDIYDEIIKENNWESYRESKERLLRKKFQFIVEKILHCKKDNFKIKGNYEIPILDAPIVKNLLLQAIDDENIVHDWFNESLNLKDSAEVVLLYICLKPVIMQAEMQGLTDNVTTNEWLAVIRTVIDYKTAEKTNKMKNLLEDFREASLAQNHEINIGEIVSTDEFGIRKVVMQPQNILDEEIEKAINLVINKITSQDECYDIINYFLQRFISEAESKSIKDIEGLAEIKKNIELDSARDLCEVPDEDFGEYAGIRMASDYVAYYNNIYQYLKKKPEIVENIENEVGVQNLLDFFNMSR